MQQEARLSRCTKRWPQLECQNNTSARPLALTDTGADDREMNIGVLDMPHRSIQIESPVLAVDVLERRQVQCTRQDITAERKA